MPRSSARRRTAPFPSGHATEAFAAAAVLSALFPARAAYLRLMAARIAMNRSFGGVHYLVDHHAGAMLGDLWAGWPQGAPLA